MTDAWKEFVSFAHTCDYHNTQFDYTNIPVKLPIIEPNMPTFVFAGEFDDLNPTKIRCFLEGITLLGGDNWRDYAINYLSKHLDSRFVIYIPEPRDRKIADWRTFCGGMGHNYTQVGWELFCLKHTNIKLMYLPCYLTAKQAGHLFRERKCKLRPNILALLDNSLASKVISQEQYNDLMLELTQANTGMTVRAEAGRNIGEHCVCIYGSPDNAVGIDPIMQHANESGVKKWFHLGINGHTMTGTETKHIPHAMLDEFIFTCKQLVGDNSTLVDYSKYGCKIKPYLSNVGIGTTHIDVITEPIA